MKRPEATVDVFSFLLSSSMARSARPNLHSNLWWLFSALVRQAREQNKAEVQEGQGKGRWQEARQLRQLVSALALASQVRLGAYLIFVTSITYM